MQKSKHEMKQSSGRNKHREIEQKGKINRDRNA